MSISRELIPLVMGDRIAGHSYKQLADKYDLRYSEVRNTCREYKHQFGNMGEVSLADPTNLFSGAGMQPFNPSALISRKGMRIIDQMRKDDQIKAAMLFKKMAVLSTGWEIVSPEGQTPDWEQTKFIQSQFKEIEGSFDDVLMEVMTGLDYGFSCSEIILKQLEAGDFLNKVGLKNIKTRRPHEMDFKIDEFGNLTELWQETSDGTLKLPPSKFVIFTYQKEFANFYGRSDLESAYRPWWIKENAYRWLAMLLERFGIPPIFALYDPNSLTPQQITDLVNVINRIQAATSGALPRANADSLELWTPQLAGQTERVFIPALEMFNQDIARALLMPGLLGATSDAKEGSFARAKVQFDVFLLIVSRLRAQLQDVLMDQVVKPLVQLNFGAEDGQLPEFRFLPLTDELRIDIMQQWGQFTGAGIVTPQESDEGHIRKAFGFPELDEKGPPPAAQIPLGGEVPPGGAIPKADTKEPVADDAALQAEIKRQLEGSKKTEQSQITNVIRFPEKHFHDYQISRKPNSFEQRIDFEQIERSLDEIERRGKEKLVPAIVNIRDRFLKFVGSNFDNNIAFLNRVDELKGLPAVRKAFVDTMMDAMTTGSGEVRKELKGIKNLPKEFADNPNFNATAAAKFLRSKADFFISSMNDSITKKAKTVLSNAIETGELLRDTQRSLRALFEPWVGNPNVIRDGEQIKPYRLETIIRTNATDSFNRGRLIEARKAGDLVTGFEYSAIIDSKTTAICRHLDEKIFLSDDPTINEFVPPNHFNCRSILVPILLDEEIEDTEIVTEAQRGRARELQQEGFGKKPPVVRGFLEALEDHEYHQPGQHPQKRHGRRKGRISISDVVGETGLIAQIRQGLRKKFDPDTQGNLAAWGKGNFSKWTGNLKSSQVFTIGYHSYTGATAIARLIAGDLSAAIDISKAATGGLEAVIGAFEGRAGTPPGAQARDASGRFIRRSFTVLDESYEYVESIDRLVANTVVEILDSALATATIPEDILVYRGIITDQFIGDADDLVGTVIQNKSFTSTTLDRNVVVKNAPDEGNYVILEILVPEGSTGAYLNELLSPGEHEIMLPRDSKFKITGKRGNTVELELL